MPHLASIAWRLILGGVFLIAGISKLLRFDPALMPHTMYGSLLIRWPWAGYLLCVVEIALGIWLITGWRRRLAAIAALGVLLAFSGVIAVELRRADPRRCGCFAIVTPQGVFDPAAARRQLWLDLLRNGILIAAAVYLTGCRARPGTPDPGASR